MLGIPCGLVLGDAALQVGTNMASEYPLVVVLVILEVLAAVSSLWWLSRGRGERGYAAATCIVFFVLIYLASTVIFPGAQVI